MSMRTRAASWWTTTVACGAAAFAGRGASASRAAWTAIFATTRSAIRVAPRSPGDSAGGCRTVPFSVVTGSPPVAPVIADPEEVTRFEVALREPADDEPDDAQRRHQQEGTEA